MLMVSSVIPDHCTDQHYRSQSSLFIEETIGFDHCSRFLKGRLESVSHLDDFLSFFDSIVSEEVGRGISAR